MGVAVTCGIQPVVGAMFAGAQTRQQAVHSFLVCISRPVRNERCHFFGSGGKACEVVGDASDQSWPVGLFRRLQPFFLQTAEDERINRGSRPLLILSLRNRGALGSYERSEEHTSEL